MYERRQRTEGERRKRGKEQSEEQADKEIGEMKERKEERYKERGSVCLCVYKVWSDMTVLAQ